MSLKKVAAELKRNKKFLITTHINPEGDALGAELAFYKLIKALGKKAVIINDDILPYGYDFLPQAKRIKYFRPGLKIDFDCFAILDCSDLARCGDVYKLNKLRKPILNIDHHISNPRFGDINLVDHGASSCSEIVYMIFKQLRVPIDKEIATLLYIGILTDTGSFRYSNTSGFTHQIVAELLKYRLDIVEIYRQLYENKPLKELKILSKLLQGVCQSEGGRIVWFQLYRSALKNKVASFDLNERLLNFARSVKNVEVAVIFKEIQGSVPQVKISLRSRGQIDVNKIARFFGGGGHVSASSCTVAGKIPQVRKKVLAKIREYLK